MIDNHKTSQATHEEVCDQALEHYEEISKKAKHWSSTVPTAIEFYKKNFKDKAIKPALYAISKEKGFSILIPVIEFLIENFNPLSCKDLLIQKIKNLDNKSLKHDLNLMKLENLNLLRLKNIIYDSLLRNSLENLYFHRRKIPFAVDLDYID